MTFQQSLTLQLPQTSARGKCWKMIRAPNTRPSFLIPTSSKNCSSSSPSSQPLWTTAMLHWKPLGEARPKDGSRSLPNGSHKNLRMYTMYTSNVYTHILYILTFACLYVCMLHGCGHASMQAGKHAFKCACWHVRKHVRMHASSCTYNMYMIYVCSVFTCIYKLNINKNMYIQIHVNLHMNDHWVPQNKAAWA